MDVPVKRKVTAKLAYNTTSTFPRVQPLSRPASPSKLPSPSPSHRARAPHNATVRKLASSSSLNAPVKPKHHAPTSVSRPGSPFKSLRSTPNGSPSPPSHLRAAVVARPTAKVARASSRAQTRPGPSESRQRSLTSVSHALRSPPPDDRPRSGSVGLGPPSLRPHPSPVSGPPDGGRANSPQLPPIRIRSKVSSFAKSANGADSAACSMPPSCATTRPIHPRARAPSLTLSTSLNPASTTLLPTAPVVFPISTAVPAANPHRYAPLRPIQPPVRGPQTFMFPQDAQGSKKSPLVPKVDVPLPQHSPPISALSLSSKSSVTHSPAMVLPDFPLEGARGLIATGSHGRGTSVDWRGAPGIPSLSVPQPHAASPSGHAAPRTSESDGESDEDSEKQLRAEAKTNRKIADLEITNRSLLAINASLETTKNRQAKEIWDLRRKLRESRLILPPRAYKALRASFPGNEGAAADRDCDGDDDSDDTEDAGDEGFRRVSCLLEALIQSGKRALEVRAEDFREASAKVLSADELSRWQDSRQHDASASDHAGGGSRDGASRSSFTHGGAVPDSDFDSFLDSEHEGCPVEASPPPLPPITITPS